jgi:hypothetical protein
MEEAWRPGIQLAGEGELYCILMDHDKKTEKYGDFYLEGRFLFKQQQG